MGALDLDRAAEDAVGPDQRLLEEVRGTEDRIGDAQVEGLLPLEHAVVLQRVRDHDLERVLDPDQVGQQPGASPAGDDAEEHLGERERRDRGVDGAVVGVQTDLDTAAEGESVDEDERRNTQIAQLAECGVSELGHQLAGRAVRDLADPGEVGAGRQDERLAGDRDARDLLLRGPCSESVEDGGQLEQRGRTERVGPGVVSTVVQCDQREHPAAGQRMSLTKECVTTSSGSSATSWAKSILE